MSIKSSSKMKKILEVKRIHCQIISEIVERKLIFLCFLDHSCIRELHEQWEERISIWISTPKSGFGEKKSIAGHFEIIGI